MVTQAHQILQQRITREVPQRLAWPVHPAATGGPGRCGGQSFWNFGFSKVVIIAPSTPMAERMPFLWYPWRTVWRAIILEQGNCSRAHVTPICHCLTLNCCISPFRPFLGTNDLHGGQQRWIFCRHWGPGPEWELGWRIVACDKISMELLRETPTAKNVVTPETLVVCYTFPAASRAGTRFLVSTPQNASVLVLVATNVARLMTTAPSCSCCRLLCWAICCCCCSCFGACCCRRKSAPADPCGTCIACIRAGCRPEKGETGLVTVCYPPLERLHLAPQAPVILTVTVPMTAVLTAAMLRRRGTMMRRVLIEDYFEIVLTALRHPHIARRVLQVQTECPPQGPIFCHIFCLIF